MNVTFQILSLFSPLKSDKRLNNTQNYFKSENVVSRQLTVVHIDKRQLLKLTKHSFQHTLTRDVYNKFKSRRCLVRMRLRC